MPITLSRGQSLHQVLLTTIDILERFMDKQILITLTNGQTDYNLKFRLLDYSITQSWLKHLELFIKSGHPWDDPKRFYNFPNSEYSESVVANRLRHLIGIIKNYAPEIITKDIGATITQDDLNYFHHIFEVYHGLYDAQKENEFFSSAPTQVQEALGDLNIWIHRYESLNGMPRFVATWKYKPYRDKIADQDYQLFSLKEEWGDLRLNYCEIGKSLYDLWHDNDKYIDPTAFQPLRHFCFDFTVRFTNTTAEDYQEKEIKIWDYFDSHKDFFHKQGYTKYDPKLSLGGITIAKIESTHDKQTIIDAIGQHQQFKNIQIV